MEEIKKLIEYPEIRTKPIVYQQAYGLEHGTRGAYNAVRERMDFRASVGEEIAGESWILRNT